MQSRNFARSLSIMLVVAPLSAQAVEPVDTKANEVLRKHGLEQSQVMNHLSWICDVYGPRLTNSPNIRNAQGWAKQTFEQWGLHKPHFEAWGPFGRGWRLDGFSMKVAGDNPWQVHAYPKAWSPGLPTTLKAQVVAVGEMTAEQLKAADLKGKIVMIEAPRPLTEAFEGTARRFQSDDLLEMANAAGGVEGRRGRRNRSEAWRAGFQRRRQVMEIVYAKQPALLLDRGSKGAYGTIFVTGASAPASAGPRGNIRDPKVKGVVPQFTLAVEH